MNHGQTMFSQGIDFLPKKKFRQCVNRNKGDLSTRSFTCYDQLSVHGFCQQAYRESLSDIECCLRAKREKLYHIGIRGNAWFIIRENGNYPVERIGSEKYIGKIETGTVYEQRILVRDEAGQKHTFRRIRVKLKGETRDGDNEIFIITNLSKSAANARPVAGTY